VILVCPDTNSLHGDPLFRSKPALSLLDAITDGDVEIHLSPVVVAELTRQESDLLSGTKDDLRKSVDRRYATNKPDGLRLSGEFDELVDRLGTEFNAELAAVIARTGVVVDPYPAVKAQELTKRDLERRRPFQEKGDEKKHYSTGMRDALIWEGLLGKVANSGPDDNKKSLHQDLLADLDERGIPRAKVIYAPNLYQVNTVIAEVRKTITETHARAAQVATLTLVALTGEEVGSQLQYGGDYGVPDEYSGLELPPEFEGARIVAVDQNGDAIIDRNEDGSYRVRIPATISIEGTMSTFDYYGYEDDNPFELWEHLNDHYVSVSLSQDVVFDSSVAIADGSLSVVDFGLTASDSMLPA
jgi:predicted nucleic acid-binding protein